MPERRPPPPQTGPFLDGIGIGFRLWRRSWVLWTLALVVTTVPMLAATALAAPLDPGWWNHPSIVPGASHLPTTVAVGVVQQLVLLSTAAMALGNVRRGRPELMDLLRPFRRGTVWAVSAVLGAGAAVLDAFTLFGGSVVAGLLLVYVVFRAVDGATVVGAFTEGVAAVRPRFVARIGFLLLCGVIAVAGVLACGVGAIVTVPAMGIAVAWTYVGTVIRT